MKIEEGKYYRNRKDEVMGPLKRSDTYGSNQFCAPRVDGMGPTVYWYESGRHLPDGTEDAEDLILEIQTYPIAPDMVNHPPHYQSEKGIECIDAIEAAMTVEEFRGYLRGNCLKYLWRAEKKGREEDLKKAAWYLNKLIETPKP